jgi:hypothetical protein
MVDDNTPVPSGPLIPNTTRRKPEWDMWVSVPHANLWAAVALSCDFHPDAIHFFDERDAPDLQQYWKRYTIALANVQARILRLVDQGPKQGGMLGALHEFTFVINLAEFVAWAQGLPVPWELPAEFTVHTGDSKKSRLNREWYGGRVWLTLQEASELAALSAASWPYEMTDKEYQDLRNAQVGPRLIILRRHTKDDSLQSYPNSDRKNPDPHTGEDTNVEVAGLRRIFAAKGWPWPLDQSEDQVSRSRWPWGTYSDGWLPHLEAAVTEFWKDYDPKVPDGKDRSKGAVLKFLCARTDPSGHKISETKAKAIDTVVRPKAWPTGPSRGHSFPKEKRSEKKS